MTNLHENLVRIYDLMGIKEQLINRSNPEEVEMNDLESIKEILLQNSELMKKIMSLLGVNSNEELFRLFDFPNKTSFMKAMQKANQNKDEESFKLLDQIVKIKN